MSHTVEWGIDLGTTNSAIARMTRKGPEVVQVSGQNYIPSAVAKDKRGELKVGASALLNHASSARWFKRLMGTQQMLALGEEQWSPERLSAEVLKALRAAAYRRTNEEIEDVVITVPAMFLQPQCAATVGAAKLAGLNAVALLQEPIAAATAYLSDSPEEGDYLVYDLGGGTFDVSLIRLRAGEMTVVEHGGDNYLGGSDFDRAIFEWVLDQIDRKGGDTRVFESGWQRSQLLLACEDARVQVSDSEAAIIYLDDFDLPVAKIELSRSVTEDLISDLVTRTIEIAKDRLPSARGKVRSVLMVGGPTQMPYIRRRLQEEFGIPLAFDQDPMTVVAAGAAVHAGTIIRRRKSQSIAAVGGAKIELHYEPVSPEPINTVAGKIVDPHNFDGEVQLAASDGLWESGWHSLQDSGFIFEVPLGRQLLSEYSIALRDKMGREVECEPSTFVIRNGIRSAQPVVPYNYGVVLQEDRVHFVVKAGDVLPASGWQGYELADTIIAGSPDQKTIYFVEGNSAFGVDNHMVGELVIRGADISRTIKEGEKIEIRIRVDENRVVTAKVYVPLLDEEYVVPLKSMLHDLDVTDLTKRFESARQAIELVESRVDDDEQEAVLRAERKLEQVEALLVKAEKGDTEDRMQAHNQLAEVTSSLRHLTDKYSLQATYDKVMEYIGDARPLCEEFNDNMGLAKLDDASVDAGKALRLENAKALEGIKERVLEIFWEHYVKTTECWVGWIIHLRQRSAEVTDSLSYFEFIRQAEQFLAEDDLEGVRINVARAMELLPLSTQASQRFPASAIRLG
jgi:molecular chaperone DnaK